MPPMFFQAQHTSKRSCCLTRFQSSLASVKCSTSLVYFTLTGCYLCVHYGEPGRAAVTSAIYFTESSSGLQPSTPAGTCCGATDVTLSNISTCHQPASKILPLSLCNGLSTGHVLGCICRSVREHEPVRQGSPRLRPSESYWTCAHVYT